MTKRTLIWLGLVTLLLLSVSVSAAQDADGDDMADANDTWWNDRVFYEIFVRSFNDSDGDGIGDFQGIIERLDYLNDGDPNTTDDLGITGIWLMPISPSPSYHGYDVTDYYGINPDYGTMADFQAFMDAAHERGIAVIVDLVVNHSSSQHPWFQASVEDPDGEFGDWYIWEDEDPGYRGPDSQVVWHPRDGRYYYGVFWSGMPDLNYNNPDVSAEMFNIADFWLTEMGVDGFRLDAIKYIVEMDRAMENTAPTRQWLADFRDHVRSINPGALIVGEAWTSTEVASIYVPESSDIVFEFILAESLLSSASFGVSSSLVNQMETVLELYPENQFATFLSNHDQNRIMSALRGDVDAARQAASVYLLGPGVPFIYYGEEIGMVGVKPDEDIRTPMQWDPAQPNAGFSTGSPWRAVNADWEQGVTVADQDADPDSLLNHYRELVHLRNANVALRRGSTRLVESERGNVYALLRETDEQTLLVIVNLRDRELDDYALSLPQSDLSSVSGARLIYGGQGDLPTPEIDDAGGFSGYLPLPTLPPLATVVVELEPGG